MTGDKGIARKEGIETVAIEAANLKLTINPLGEMVDKSQRLKGVKNVVRIVAKIDTAKATKRTSQAATVSNFGDPPDIGRVCFEIVNVFGHLTASADDFVLSRTLNVANIADEPSKGIPAP
ncbi:MAG: hypothetical protein D6743_20030 [Calditrichaeota bacterium]|nr:MAG: hypothetical protein D6743_20030 [Calditrichota bacterium]